MSLNRRKLSVSWSQYYEEMLLDMWERSIRNLEPYTGLTKTQIRRMMAKQLDDAGFIGIEAKEVRNKQENLTKKYRVEAKKLESHWIHFERLHEMFRHCRPANPVDSFDKFDEAYEETEYLTEYLEANAEDLEGKRDDQSPEPTPKKVKRPVAQEKTTGYRDDDQSSKPPPKKAKKSVPFEVGMLAAARERNRELRKFREQLIYLGERRLTVLERLEKTMNRMEAENSRFHQQMLEKKS